MALPNIFSKEVADNIIKRINDLSADTMPQWGKMNVSQMLAHCNVSYEMVYEDKHTKPNGLMKVILKLLVKNKVVNEVPYKKNNPTAPAFIIRGDKEFDGKESHSFGKLSLEEWNNMFYKHLDHHLRQFGK